jgi:phosphoglycerate dehydrogenase-like enzyme
MDALRPASMDALRWHVGLVGYGEVGRILAEDLRAQGVAVSAFDLKLGTDAGETMARHAGAGRVAR